MKIRQAKKIAKKYWRWWRCDFGRADKPDFRWGTAEAASKRLRRVVHQFLRKHRT